MRCSYCKLEVPYNAMACPHCQRATVQRSNYDTTPSDDGMGMVGMVLAGEAIAAIADSPSYTQDPTPTPDTGSFDGFGGGDSGGGGATSDF